MVAPPLTATTSASPTAVPTAPPTAPPAPRATAAAQPRTGVRPQPTPTQADLRWDPAQFEPDAATPCTIATRSQVADALNQTMLFANGSATCCATAYFSIVLRPLSWMAAEAATSGAVGGDLCIPDGYWENLGWHLANFAAGMHTNVIGDVGSYNPGKCHFPRGLKEALWAELRAWACTYAPAAERIGAAPAVRFTIPVYSGSVDARTVPGGSVVGDLRQCPTAARGGGGGQGGGRVAPTTRWDDHRPVGGGAAVAALARFGLTISSAEGSVNVNVGGHQGGAKLQGKKPQRSKTRNRFKLHARRAAAFAPSSKRCRTCPRQYMPVNSRYCCARMCTSFGRAMDLAATSGAPSQAGCCVKMNRRCRTTK